MKFTYGSKESNNKNDKGWEISHGLVSSFLPCIFLQEKFETDVIDSTCIRSQIYIYI